MGKFIMDTEAVQAIANEINTSKNNFDNIAGEFYTNSVETPDSGGTDGIDFEGAMKAIKANMCYVAEKFANISTYISDAIAIHTAIQDETTIDIEDPTIGSSPSEPTIIPDEINSGENTIYTIKQGDNLSKIAKMYRTSVEALLAFNPYIKDKDLIYPGNELIIPSGEKDVEPQVVPQADIPEQPKGNPKVENNEETKPNPDNITVDGYKSNEDFPVTTGNKTYNLSQKDMEQLMAIVAAEARNESKDDCLAVASVILNRCENEWHVNTFGEGPIAQATAPKQFTGYGNSNYYEALGGNVNDNVRQAVTDALNGVRNNDYLYFRSYDSDPEKYGNTMIYEIGNRYY